MRLINRRLPLCSKGPTRRRCGRPSRPIFAVTKAAVVMVIALLALLRHDSMLSDGEHSRHPDVAWAERPHLACIAGLTR